MHSAQGGPADWLVGRLADWLGLAVGGQWAGQWTLWSVDWTELRFTAEQRRNVLAVFAALLFPSRMGLLCRPDANEALVHAWRWAWPACRLR